MAACFDDVVVGGGPEGCFSAMAAAGQGKKVALVESRPYLGWEITVKLRPWLHSDGCEEFLEHMGSFFLPDQEQAEVHVHKQDLPLAYSDEIMLFVGTVKKQLFQELLRNNVTVLLMSHVVGVLTDGDQTLTSVILANKFGVQQLQTACIVDASEHRVLSRQLGRKPDRGSSDLSLKSCPQSQDATARFVMEFTGVKLSESRRMPVDPSLGNCSDQVVLHAGKAKYGQIYAEFAIPCSYEHTQECRQETENQNREKAMAVTRSLVRDQESFSEAGLFHLAEEVGIILSGDEAPSSGDVGIKGYWILPSKIPAVLSCRDLVQVKQTAEAWMISVLSRSGDPHAIESLVHGEPTGMQLRLLNNTVIPGDACEVCETNDRRLRDTLTPVRIPLERYKVASAAADVVVAGGGTSGALSAVAAAQEGRDVAVVESMPELGGTRTVGLVAGDYYGKQIGMTSYLADRITEINHELYGCAEDSHDRVSRMLCYRRMFLRQNGSLLTNSIVFAVHQRDDQNQSVYAVNAYGIRAYQAGVYVDATGDGDLAWLCGKQFEFGQEA